MSPGEIPFFSSLSASLLLAFRSITVKVIDGEIQKKECSLIDGG